MKKIKVFIFFLVLLSTNHCYANEIGIESKFQVFVIQNDKYILQTDFRNLIKLEWPDFTLSFGKEQLIWGVGQTGTLALSPTSPSIPFVQYHINLDRFYYNRFMSHLEKETDRWLFGHRLEGKLYSLKIGIWELMLCSDEVFSGYFLPIPLFPLYATQHLGYKLFDTKYDKNSNAMLGMDFTYSVDDFGEVYGEMIIDDFPQKEEYSNPRKAGGLLGIKFNVSDYIDIWTEYVRINNFVYTHRNPMNRYLFFNRPFGHWLGMDGDLWAIGLNQEVREDTRLYWQVHKIRKGEGDYTDNWKLELGRDYEFLTGIVEHSYQLHVIAEHDFTENLQFKVGAIIGQSHNADHIENIVENYVEFNAGLSGQFQLLHN